MRQIITKIDRTVFLSDISVRRASDGLTDFRTTADHPLNNSGAAFYNSYGRVRNLVNDSSGTEIDIEYQPRLRKMASLRVSVHPDDAAGLSRREAENIFQAFPSCSLRKVEIACDFPNAIGIDAEFVRRHLKLGKSRLRHGRKYPHAAWFGAAHAAKFVRSYPKAEVDGYRIELQLNHPFLSKHNIHESPDFARLAEVAESQIRFFDLDWQSLSRSIWRHYPRHAPLLLTQVKARCAVLTELLKFLGSIGISNPTRFLVPMSINRTVSAALRRWARRWTEG
jgi:hypothetical protein